jgi:hypothetical protein
MMTPIQIYRKVTQCKESKEKKNTGNGVQIKDIPKVQYFTDIVQYSR